MEGWLLDLRVALRTLRRQPAFAAAALITLAFGAGLNATAFGVLNLVVLRPLPYSEAHELVAVGTELDGGTRHGLSIGAAAELQRTTTAFESVAWMELPHLADPVVLSGEVPERIAAAWVSADFFRTLGVSPRIGRTFAEGEDREGGPRSALLSHAAWQARWGGDPGIVGRVLRLNGDPVSVVGVLPANLEVPVAGDAPELWLARPYGAFLLESRDAWIAQVIARLRPDATIDDARRELASLTATTAERFPELHSQSRFTATPLHTFQVGDARAPLLFLSACAALVLLVACANLGILFAARSAARRSEIAVRHALGAGHARVARSILAEGLLLGSLGTALGLLLSRVTLDAIRAFAPDLPRLDGPWLDARLILFTAATALLAGLAASIAPLARALRTAPASVLRTRAAGSGGTLGRTLIAGECAAVVALLLGATLAGRGFLALLATDPGFATENRLIADVALPPSMGWEAADGEQRNFAFFEQARRRLEELPGVRGAGFVSNPPLTPASWSGQFRERGDASVDAPMVDWEVAGTGYFEAAGIDVLEGRSFAAEDRTDAPLVAIVNETLARRFFPEGDAVGRVITGESDDGPWRTIVGIVADVKQQSLGQGATRPQMYIHEQQSFAFTSRKLVVYTQGDPLARIGDIRAALAGVDADVAVDDFRPLDSLVGASAAGARFQALLLLGFAAVSTTLGLAGVMGVVSDAVQRRRGEIAVRMALGAQRRTVLLAELRDGLAPVVLGIVAGLALAAAGARLARGLVQGLGALDAMTALGVSCGLLLAAAIAVLGPARRAASIAPATVLRGE